MNIRQGIDLVTRMGLPWAAFRAGYALKNRLGWLERRFPLADWSRYAIDNVPGGDLELRLFDRPDDASTSSRLAEWHATADPCAEVNDVRAGRWRLFSGIDVDAGFPPEWHRHPLNGRVWPRDHWSRLPEMGDSDVKAIWEFGRFQIAYSCARAWRRTADPVHAETFWQLVEDWRRKNPPNHGAHWMCGQECAIRVLAWCFALSVLRDAPQTTEGRVRMLLAMLAAHGDRIQGNIEFALSQKNNHSINEALALFTLGIALPSLPGANDWEAQGRTLLEREAIRQIYADGSYVQHSLNYHRMIVQSYGWAFAIAERSGRPLSDALRERYLKAVELLYQLTDSTGCAPNYGSNDGGQLFSLDACAFEDYRPALALGFWSAARRRVFPPGPWDEPLWWFYGGVPFDAPPVDVPRASTGAESGGYYTLRGRESWGFVRCCTYRDRPAQADELHLDIWWRGDNLIADPGTFSYNSAPPWNNGLSRTRVHNTIEVDETDQMERGPRFTWFDWTRARALRHEANEAGGIFEGEHLGYVRRLGVKHRRAVLFVADVLWLIVDDLTGSGEHEVSSQWLLPSATVASSDEPCRTLDTPGGPVALVFRTFSRDLALGTPAVDRRIGDGGSTYGWHSTRYLQRAPALGLVVTERLRLPARRFTLIGLGVPLAVETIEAARLAVRCGDALFECELAPIGGDDSGSIVVSHGVTARA